MADGATPNLGLKLIEVGGSRDNWGQKVNDNMTALDGAVKAVRDTANGALSRAGGTVTGDIRRDGQGALIHWTDDAMDRGNAYLTPSTGTDPTGMPGDIWFGYTA